MAAGIRSPLAPWAGGASAPEVDVAAAFRSPLAFWAGGASAPAAVVNRGVRSLLAFWAGGAAGYTTTVVEPPIFGGGGLFVLPRPLRDELRHRRIDEDDMLLLLAACLDGNVLLH